MIAAASGSSRFRRSKRALLLGAGGDITLECEPSKALWADGRGIRTHGGVSVKVLPGALPVVVP